MCSIEIKEDGKALAWERKKRVKDMSDQKKICRNVELVGGGGWRFRFQAANILIARSRRSGPRSLLVGRTVVQHQPTQIQGLYKKKL